MQILIIAFLLVSPLPATDAELVNERYKTINPRPDYEHTKYSPTCSGYEKEFGAYVSCFDSLANDGVAWRIPLFVSYHMKKYPGRLPKGPKRPSPWLTVSKLVSSGEMSSDDSYKYSRSFRRQNKNWFVRGHLAMKQHAWRLGEEADWNTHTMLNAVPQRDDFNRGVWLDLENHTADMADKDDEVWIIAGPVFWSGQPTAWIGEASKGEALVAVPDALFKIVLTSNETTAYLFPQISPDYSSKSYGDFETTVDRLETLTGLDFKIYEEFPYDTAAIDAVGYKYTPWVKESRRYCGNDSTPQEQRTDADCQPKAMEICKMLHPDNEYVSHRTSTEKRAVLDVVCRRR